MKTTFKMMKMELSEILEIFNDMERAKDNLSFRIIMEKENKGLSNVYLLDKLLKFNHDKYEKYVPDDIRKRLESKKPNAQLVEDLCNILEIDNDNESLLEVVASYRYHLNKDKIYKGRTSKKEIEKRRERYEKIHDELELSDGNSLEKTIYEVFSTNEKYSYNGIECDWETYSEYMNEDIKKEMLKKILVINQYYPEEVDDFLDRFGFDDECNAKLEKLDVKIKYL